MRYTLVFNSLGYILRKVGVVVLLPALFALIIGEYGEILPFAVCAAVAITLGWILAINPTDAKREDLKKSEAMCIATLTWIAFGLVCSIPYFFYHLAPLDCLFEAYSGITTTGLSIVNDYSLYPKTFFFYRAMTQWVGGMGIIVLFIAVLPSFAIAGRQMFSAELPGPTQDKFTPRIHETALWLWTIYVTLTVIQILLLKFIGKMDFYNSICCAFSTMSSGGFSNHSTSIAYYHNNAVNWIIVVFMFLSGCNFVLQYKVIIQRKFSLLLKNTEFMTYVGIIITVSLIISLMLICGNHMEVTKAISNSIFMTVSTITTTGMNVTDYEIWNFDARTLLFLLMFSGACASSTSGGIKLSRCIFIIKKLKNELARIIHPNAIYPLKIDNKTVGSDVIQQLITFLFFFVVIFAVTTFFIALIEEDVSTAISGSITTLGNSGVAFGDIIGPDGNVHSLHFMTKIIFIINMVAGRLELIPFLAILQPDLWIKR